VNTQHGHGQNKDTKATKGRWRNSDSISAVQFEAVKKAARKKGVTFETEPIDGPPLFIWQKDHILVSAEVDFENNDALRQWGAVLAPVQEGFEPVERPDLARLFRLETLNGTTDPQATRKAVEALNEKKGLEGKVFVNNLLYVTHEDGVTICPASEPLPQRPYPQTTPYPPPSTGDAGKGVHIVVIDTGLSAGWDVNHPWLYDPSKPVEVSGDGEPDTFDDLGHIAQHAGHGSFIAGVIRCVAPRARVTVKNTMRWSGTMTEAGVADAILTVLDHDKPDIISLSAGCMIHSGRGGGPKAMLDVLKRLKQPNCRTVLVAATGNDGHGPADHGRFYPAGFAGGNPYLEDVDPTNDHDYDDYEYDYVGTGALVAVGALRQDRQGRACFSNYDKWVTVYEDGENVINAFPTGNFTYHEPASGTTPPQCTYYPNRYVDDILEKGCTCVTAPALGTVAQFDGMASWSGTSFATPIVAARIARRMTENPQPAGPREAALDLLHNHVKSIGDAGDGFELPVFVDAPIF
jgi:hypothetical protein